MKGKNNKFVEITKADIFRYYIGWEDTDKELIEAIKKGDEEQFHVFLKNMTIARNFKKNTYKDVYKLTREYVKRNTSEYDVNNFSDLLFQAQLLAGDNKNAIVAASKILWIYNKEKTIIYDSRAKNALKNISEKKGLDDYTDYCKAWKEQYKVFKSRYLEKIKENEIDKLDSLFKQEWFIRRTFDNYLWYRGKTEK